MTITLRRFAVLLTAVCLHVAAFAAEASPAGTWKWTQPGRSGGPGFEQTLKLDYEGAKLTGTLLGGETPRGKFPDAPIAEASFQNGTVAFSVTRTFNDFQFTIKYEGKLDGDTIKGTSERPNRDGGDPVKREWTATRSP